MDDTQTSSVLDRVNDHPDLVFRASKGESDPESKDDRLALLKGLLQRDPALFLGTN